MSLATPEPDLWRALSSPWRRRLLDLLRDGPRTTGQLAAAIPELSRFAVMQHVEVLTSAGVITARKRGRERFNHLNPVPLRAWYERWVLPLADTSAAGLLALRRIVEQTGESTMDTAVEQVRIVRIASELRFRAGAAKVFEALTERTLEWFPHTYGGDKVRAVIIEPHVGGRLYEDWGGDRGHLYGHVTLYDPPHQFAIRGRLMPGTVLDTEYEIVEEGADAVLRMTRVAVGPMTEEEAAGVGRFGDLANFADVLRAVVEEAA
jgi:DNA-binding transcriptional ArsR family regulator